MTFGEITTEAEGSARRELAPLTDAQRLTVDALALACAATWRAPCDVAAVASTFERGAVLVLVDTETAAPNPVTAVYAPDGTRHAVTSDADYRAALTAVGGPWKGATRRRDSAAFVVRAGGSYLAEADAERWRVGRRH